MTESAFLPEAEALRPLDLIGILQQPRIPETAAVAEEIGAWLSARGVAHWTAAPWDEGEDLGESMGRTSMLVVLGGDGSMLKAARLSVPHNVPIFGINLGRVGFLSEADPNDWPEKLQRVLDGAYWVERRLLIHAELWREGKLVQPFTALNEIVVGRGAQARVIRLSLRVDGDLVTTYIADALIVATPTGSTAYAMAAGGPLLPPQLENFVVVPVAAHLSLNRSMVLHEEARIMITVEDGHETNLTADGHLYVQLVPGDEVIITKHFRPCRFVRVTSPGYFYRRLMDRLGFSWPHH